jgi:hypothetical protein
MTFELSLQTKMIALVGLLVAAGAAGTLLLSHKKATSQPLAIPPTHAHVVTPATGHRFAVRPVSAASRLEASLPVPLQKGLARSRTVVAVVYAPGDALDAVVLAQARQGANSQHAGFVALNVHDDAVAGATATWMKSVFEPAVLVVKRPGKIAAELDGYVDSTMVAQAVVDSRR